MKGFCSAKEKINSTLVVSMMNFQTYIIHLNVTETVSFNCVFCLKFFGNVIFNNIYFYFFFFFC